MTSSSLVLQWMVSALMRRRRPGGRKLPWADALGLGFNPGMIAGRACAAIRICNVEESNFSYALRLPMWKPDSFLNIQASRSKQRRRRISNRTYRRPTIEKIDTKAVA
jgi:hypothetical protein